MRDVSGVQRANFKSSTVQLRQNTRSLVFVAFHISSISSTVTSKRIACHEPRDSTSHRAIQRHSNLQPIQQPLANSRWGLSVRRMILCNRLRRAFLQCTDRGLLVNLYLKIVLLRFAGCHLLEMSESFSYVSFDHE